MNRLLIAVFATLAALMGVQPGTTTASSAKCVYDGQALAHVGAVAVSETTAVGPSPAQLDGVL